MHTWTTTKRVARYGLAGFVRNGFISLAAILILTVTLFVVASLMLGGAALSFVLQDLTGKVDVTVYLAQGASQEQANALTRGLSALPEVASVTYVSEEEALAAFQKRHASDQLIMQALQQLDSNPLGASLQVKAKETSQYEAIARFLEAQQKSGTPEGATIDAVNFFRNKTAIDRLTDVIETSRELGIGIAIVLALSSILIAFNTIRLAIYTSRDEIAVMNLVGASHWYVRGPFVIAGVLYGLAAGILVLLILYPATLSLGQGSERFFGGFNVFSYYLSAFPLFFLVIVGSGVALGALSSYLAIRRYLR